MKIGTIVTIKYTVERYGGMNGRIITMPIKPASPIYVVHVTENGRALALHKNDFDVNEVVTNEDGNGNNPG